MASHTSYYHQSPLINERWFQKFPSLGVWVSNDKVLTGWQLLLDPKTKQVWWIPGPPSVKINNKNTRKWADINFGARVLWNSCFNNTSVTKAVQLRSVRLENVMEKGISQHSGPEVDISPFSSVFVIYLQGGRPRNPPNLFGFWV